MSIEFLGASLVLMGVLLCMAALMRVLNKHAYKSVGEARYKQTEKDKAFIALIRFGYDFRYEEGSDNIREYGFTPHIIFGKDYETAYAAISSEVDLRNRGEWIVAFEEIDEYVPSAMDIFKRMDDKGKIRYMNNFDQDEYKRLRDL